MPDASETSSLTVESHRGPYVVHFAAADEAISADAAAQTFFLADARVLSLYPDLASRLDPSRLVTMDATEPNKNLTRVPELAERFLTLGLRRDATLVAIGGGITQDVACFLASVLMRGVPWKFYPTTLLAQADSCIGSKSSINVGQVKNSAGTFWPPREVIVDRAFLGTLPEVEIRSGVGEIIKVHIIDGPASFDQLAAEYDSLFTDPAVLQNAIRRSLEIKRRIIELDEFDTGPRQVLNYGHTFGHAIESATEYAIPHGIAVSIGMDMANHVATSIGRLPKARRDAMSRITRRNARGFMEHDIPFDRFARAIKGDKKVGGGGITAILPNGDGVPERVKLAMDETFFDHCRRYLEQERRA